MSLQELRNAVNLTQVQAAKLLDITIQYISMLECGTRNPSDRLKKKMAKLYRVSIADIFLAMETTKRRSKKAKTKVRWLNAKDKTATTLHEAQNLCSKIWHIFGSNVKNSQ